MLVIKCSNIVGFTGNFIMVKITIIIRGWIFVGFIVRVGIDCIGFVEGRIIGYDIIGTLYLFVWKSGDFYWINMNFVFKMMDLNNFMIINFCEFYLLFINLN